MRVERLPLPLQPRRQVYRSESACWHGLAQNNPNPRRPVCLPEEQTDSAEKLTSAPPQVRPVRSLYCSPPRRAGRQIAPGLLVYLPVRQRASASKQQQTDSAEKLTSPPPLVRPLRVLYFSPPRRARRQLAFPASVDRNEQARNHVPPRAGFFFSKWPRRPRVLLMHLPVQLAGKLPACPARAWVGPPPVHSHRPAPECHEPPPTQSRRMDPGK